MLQKTCTGTVVKQGIRNHPSYGQRYQAEAIFFRRADGTPWVRVSEGGSPSILAPVVEVGKVLRWTGPEEHLLQNDNSFTQYTAWSDGDSNITGNIETIYHGFARVNMPSNRGGTVDLPAQHKLYLRSLGAPWPLRLGQSPPGDPP